MHTGRFTAAITIERPVQVGTKRLGEPNVVWQTFAEILCEPSVRRGREHFDPATKQRFAEDVYHFRCHYDDVVGIDPKMRILDEDGQYFDIRSIRPDVEGKQDCIIECTLQDGVIGASPLLGYVADTIPDGTVGTAYSGFTVAASGGTAPYSFAMKSGAMPTGLTLNASTGAVAGTPTVAGDFSFVVEVTDDAGDTHALPSITVTIAED